MNLGINWRPQDRYYYGHRGHQPTRIDGMAAAEKLDRADPGCMARVDMDQWPQEFTIEGAANWIRWQTEQLLSELEQERQQVLAGIQA